MKKRGYIAVAVALVVLVAAVFILLKLNAPKTELLSGSISIVKDGAVIRTFTMEEITAMPYVEHFKEIVSSSSAGEKGTYRGVPLRQLLNSADESLLPASTKVIARAQDAYVTVYSSDEVSAGDGIFIAYSRDGQSLGTLEGGGTGPFRVILLDDEFGTRSVKYLSEIEIR